MQRAFVVLLLAALPCLTGCGNKYLVKGLTLPPGAEEVSFTKDGEGIGSLTSPMHGEPKRSVTSEFNYSGGWDSVVAHIDGCLKRAGYIELYEMMSEPVGGGPADPNFAELNEVMRNYMRSYLKPGGRHTVHLANLKAPPTMDLSALDKLDVPDDLAPPDAPDFQLIVVEYKEALPAN